ncbi:MAG: lipoate--protein ligase family protein [Myxococcota bacterium]|nr:lipoate--protein ligase family protein [Myxococcota bacterium]
MKDIKGPPALALVEDEFPGRPLHDTAVSHAILRQVAAREVPETLRLYVPDEVMLFSLLDARNPGFGQARQAVERLGCPSLLRMAGGHAALFHRHCLAFAWAIPQDQATEGIQERFRSLAHIVQRAFVRLGVDARIGEVPGEYCPGEYSVNAGGRLKLMGVGQRVIRGGAHVGGVIVVGQSARLHELLEPVYHHLALPWAPASAGSLEDVVPGIRLEEVRQALLTEFAQGRTLRPARLGEATRALALELEAWHSPESGSAPRSSRRALELPKTVLGGGDEST